MEVNMESEVKKTKFVLLMEERLLTLGELLRYTFTYLTDRFGSYFLIMLAAYLPSNLVMQLKLMQVDLTVEDIDLLLNQLVSVGIVQLILVFIEVLAPICTAVLMVSQVYESDKQVTVGTAFYRGMRRWFFAVSGVIIVLMGTLLCGMWMGTFMALPFLMVLVPALMLFIMILYNALLNMVCCSGAVRGLAGFMNLRYVFYIFQGWKKKAFANYAAMFIITGAFSIVVELLLANITAGIANEWLRLAIVVVFSTLASMVTMCRFIFGTLQFFNAELRKRAAAAKPQ